jgi:hypothetical protein
MRFLPSLPVHHVIKTFGIVTAYCDDIEPGGAMDALRHTRVPKTGEIAPTVEREGH